jgi:GYF domain 2
MYRIIGGDQKEYGPVTAEDIRRWIAEGRVNAQTSVTAEGITEWKPLSAFPEFADQLLSRAAPGQPPAPATQRGLPEDIFTRDYDLDIGACVGNAWALLKNNFGLVFGGVAIFLLIEIAVSAMGQIPLLGILISLANIIVTGPLVGGLFFFLLKNIRRQPTEIGEVFSGFRLAFGQLLLGYLVMAILMLLSALPGLGIMAAPVIVMFRHGEPELGPMLLALLGLIIALIPMIYLSVSWLFTLVLIIDRQMDFWPAMSASRRMVAKHWWLVFGLLVVCGLIKLAGFAACCVGLFFTLPIAYGAMMYAYESIFTAPASRPP